MWRRRESNLPPPEPTTRPSQGHNHFPDLQEQVAVLQVLPSYQEHVVVPSPFPQFVQFRASQSGARQVQLPSEHTAAAVVPTGSSPGPGLELWASPQATSSSPDSKVRRVQFFKLCEFTSVSMEWGLRRTALKRHQWRAAAPPPWNQSLQSSD
jgi:hypothetical protein